MAVSQVQVEMHGPTCIVHAGPEYDNLDIETVEDVERCLLGCADSGQIQNLIVDLSNTRFFGTSFLEVLIRTWNRVRRKNGKFALSGLQSHPEEVIRVSKLDQIWRLYATVAEAVEKIETDPPLEVETARKSRSNLLS